MTQQQEQTAKSRPMTAPLEGVPLPDLDLLPDYERGFWEGTQAGELRIQQCSGCGLFRHLPMPMCPECSSLEYGWTRSQRPRLRIFLRDRPSPGAPCHRREGTDPLQRLHDRTRGAGGPPHLQQRPQHSPRGHPHKPACGGVPLSPPPTNPGRSACRCSSLLPIN